MLRLTAVAAVLALSGLTVGTAFAQDVPPQGSGTHRRGPDGRGPGAPGAGFGGPMRLLGDLGRGFRALELSDAQREQIRGIASARQAEFREVGERLRIARRELEALVTGDAVDESGIRAKSAELASVQADAAVMRARVHQEVFSLLTAEQQAKARELRAERESRMKERMDNRRQRRPGQHRF
jgi:Spy/CpxP family protein refolding chaperone